MCGLSSNWWYDRQKTSLGLLLCKDPGEKPGRTFMAEYLWDKRPSPIHGLKPKQFFECPEKSNDRILARRFGLDSLLERVDA
jgi:hypothetical protein